MIFPIIVCYIFGVFVSRAHHFETMHTKKKPKKKKRSRPVFSDRGKKYSLFRIHAARELYVAGVSVVDVRGLFFSLPPSPSSSTISLLSKKSSFECRSRTASGPQPFTRRPLLTASL